jgi:hypothetical protein
MKKLLLLMCACLGATGSSQIVSVEGRFDAGSGEAVVPVESFLTDEGGDRLTDEAGNYLRNE